MSFNIRPYHPSDVYSIFRICLLTGDSGKDASAVYKDHEVMAQFYAAPYAQLEPDMCFTVTNNEKPCGYIIGAKDTKLFYERMEKEWLPVLRLRYPKPAEDDQSRDARIIRLIHNPPPFKEELADYPAHLHIDMLPEAQGQGLGRKLIDTFAGKVRSLGLPAFHLEVGKKNENAIGFYQKVGFHIIREYEFSIAFGMKI